MSKGTYKLIAGDATKPQRKAENEIAIIPHVCNNLGGWGAGFVLALTKAFGDLPVKTYQMDLGADSKKCLGRVSFAEIGNGDVVIANMIAQAGYIDDNNPRPLKYPALLHAMGRVANHIEYLRSWRSKPISIHCPKFGSALAGGNWEFIEALIEDVWLDAGIDVTVYEFVPPSNP